MKKKISKNEKQERERARKVITHFVDNLCRIYGYKYKKIYIKNQKTRLGSCSSLKNLNFNWQIIKLPEDIMMYVIKHEIVHLKHLNHSRKFWNELMLLDPNYKENHKWIRNNAHKYIKF